MRLPLLAAAVLCLDACWNDTQCTAQYVFGLEMRVVSSATRALICDATVTASDGAYRERLQLLPGSGADGALECVYYGAGERAGTYALDVVAGSSEKTLSDIAVGHDECHVVTRQLTVEL
jgi:hypothetical protein